MDNEIKIEKVLENLDQITELVEDNGKVTPKAETEPDAATGTHLNPLSLNDDLFYVPKKRNLRSKARLRAYNDTTKVGVEYQAQIPDFIPVLERNDDDLKEKATPLWQPNESLPDAKLKEFITLAVEKFGYNIDQALGLLSWYNHNVENAISDLNIYFPLKEKWTDSDREMFELGFSYHGKRFDRIQQMLPQKSIDELVAYYYLWKKSYKLKSTIDNMAAAGDAPNLKIRKLLETPPCNQIELLERARSKENLHFEELNMQLILKKREIQENKAKIAEMLQQTENDLEDNLDPLDNMMPVEQQQIAITDHWTNEEKHLMEMAVRDFGRKFVEIAKIIGTKSPKHVKEYYQKNRLDKLVRNVQKKSTDEHK